VGGAAGIYVEILVQDELEKIWRLTQEPLLHERWDLRFSHIEYLPRPNADEPQHFLYETRIGFGLSIRGTGESVADRAGARGDAISSLKFGSQDWKSLIRNGSGYWRYVPTPAGLRFFTWYDYEVRFGVAGRVLDRLVFRPLMGWATAWSFDRMRLWAEQEQTPELSAAFALIHVTARVTIAAVWMWHGLVPKLMFRSVDERTMLAQAHLPISLLPWVGGAEIAIGVAFLLTWRGRAAFVVNAVLMLLALVAVAVRSPEYVTAAFNPVTLNVSMIALSVMGWIAAARMPSARRCLRKAPGVRG
jgi:uncharacterized membrane protein YphA (DoxX/SURF4 family)